MKNSKHNQSLNTPKLPEMRHPTTGERLLLLRRRIIARATRRRPSRVKVGTWAGVAAWLMLMCWPGGHLWRVRVQHRLDFLEGFVRQFGEFRRHFVRVDQLEQIEAPDKRRREGL